MSETTLDVDRRGPPSSVTLEARAIATQGVAGRVKINSKESGWLVLIEGYRADGNQIRPNGIRDSEWDDSVDPLTEDEFDDFVEIVEGAANDREDMEVSFEETDNHWRITLTYDEVRG